MPHQPVIDEHAGQLLADRLVDQHRRHRRIDAAREPADHPPAADLRADLGDLGGAELGHAPVAGEAADVAREIGDQLAAVGRVDHLGVELDAVEAPRLVRAHREGRAFRLRDRLEARRQRIDGVAVAHPHLMPLALLPQPVEQRRAVDDLEIGAAELAGAVGIDRAAELLAHRLLAVADAEDRQPRLEEALRHARDSGRASRCPARPRG